jgi:MoaA/NifB/PqqE/SkfB family radical SAM enzyme
MINGLKKILKKNTYIHELGRYLNLKFRKPFTIIYVTSRCNSRCLTCNYWKKGQRDLSCDKIYDFLSMWKPKGVLLQGGEFFLHPEWERILSMIERLCEIYLLTNGILTDRLERAAKNFKVEEFTISINGEEDTQIKTRGFNYTDSILNSLYTLKRMNQEISIAFLITGITKVSDFDFVENLANDLDCRIIISIIGRQANFNIKKSSNSLYNLAQNPYVGEIINRISSSQRVPDIDKIYTQLFNSYKELKLPCKSIQSDVVILENGDILLCQNKKDIFMNIDDIKDGSFLGELKEVKQLFINCNECWLSCHRKNDIILNLSRARKIYTGT